MSNEKFKCLENKCCICAYSDSQCFNIYDKDYYCKATKKQVIKRLDDNKWPNYREYMINYLKEEYDYDYEYIDINIPEIKHTPITQKRLDKYNAAWERKIDTLIQESIERNKANSSEDVSEEGMLKVSFSGNISFKIKDANKYHDEEAAESLAHEIEKLIKDKLGYEVYLYEGEITDSNEETISIYES